MGVKLSRGGLQSCRLTRAVRRVEEAQDSCLFTLLTSPFVTEFEKRIYDRITAFFLEMQSLSRQGTDKKKRLTGSKLA